MSVGFLKSAEQAVAQQAAGEQFWLESIKDKAAADFFAAGLPSRRVERWKYTELKSIAQQTFDFSGAAGSVEIDEIDALLQRECTALLVLIDGEFDALHSRREDLPMGLRVLTLSEAIKLIPEQIEPYLAQRFAAPEDAMASLNAALLRGGFVITLDADLGVCPTIEVLHLTSNRSTPMAINTRGIVLAKAGTRARVLEHFGHIGGGNLLNAVTQIDLGANAELQYLRLQDLCERGRLIARVQARVDTDAQLRVGMLDLGGELSRLDTRVELRGDRASVEINGLTAIKGRTHSDHQLEISHAARDTVSMQNFRALVDGRARAVFAGKVIVQVGADGADAKQSTRNLLLSAHAEVNAKPELEIHADEVKCTHGATVGQLNEGAMFYLRSRGISEVQAREMLLRAFVTELLATFDGAALVEPLAARFERRFF